MAENDDHRRAQILLLILASHRFQVVMFVRREAHMLGIVEFIFRERDVVEVRVQALHGAGHGVIGAGVAFLMHRHGQHSQVGLVAGQHDFLDRRFLRRDDFELALLLFESGDFEADFHR